MGQGEIGPEARREEAMSEETAITIKEAFGRVIGPRAICQRAIGIIWWHKYLLANPEVQARIRAALEKDTGRKVLT